MPVTLVDNPPEDSKLVVEEPFGPILPLLKWSDEADVIARANDTRYGLGASVWGKDLDAVQADRPSDPSRHGVAQRGPPVHPVPGLRRPQASGIGAENSLHGLGEYTNWQSITLNKDPDAV